MRRFHIATLLTSGGLALLTILLWPDSTPDSASRVLEPVAPINVAQDKESIATPAGSAPTSPIETLPDEREATDVPRESVSGPHGKVVEEGSDKPIEGLVIQMQFAGKVFAETVTQVNGTFYFPQPDRRMLSVRVVTEEWRVSPRKYRLDVDQTEGQSELLFQAERIVAAPLRGRLVDRRTDEPVPHFLVQARGPRGEVQESSREGDPDKGEPALSTFTFHSPPRRVENILSGADGWFESSGGFEAGLLDLVLVDHSSFFKEGATFPDEDNSVEHQHAFDETTPPAVAEIRIDIGPTYRLDTTLPNGTAVEDFYATFPQPSIGLRELHRAVAENPSSSMAMFYGSAMKPNALEQQAPLRVGEPVWARFPSPVILIEALQEEYGGYDLHVRSRNGHWSGRATVSSLEGIYTELVSVTLTAHGAIEGTVLNNEGKPVPTAWIQLSPATAPSQPVREIGADGKGRFAFKWLVRGEYEVTVQDDRYDEWKSAVSIEAESTQRLEARLTAGVPLGTVSGVLRSRTGQHRSKGGSVSLKSLDDSDFFLYKTVTYRKRSGEYLAEFSFDDVPSGNYELSLQPLDNMRWETRQMIVSPPAEGLEFICEDGGPTFDLEVRAIDAETGDPIGKSWNIVWQGDPLDDVRLDDDWETGLYEAVPEGVSLHWALHAEGYRLARGDESHIHAEANHRVIEARLVRGWGQIFKVTTREREPIAGVELVADGNSLGVTDSQGMVSMDLDAKPRSLEFRYEGWHVSWGRIDPEEDGFSWGPETPVYLSPN